MTDRRKYTTLLLDADGTILDFEKANLFAFSRMMSDMGLERENTKENYDLFCRINKRRWAELETGTTDGKSLPEKIFGDFFSSIREENTDCHAADGRCLFYLSQAGFLLPGALDFVRKVSLALSVIVVTNGHDAVQKSRLKRSGVMPYLSGVYTSEQIGFPKPRAEFFEYIFSDRQNLKKEETILLGDSISSDYLGAKNAGVSACLLNLGAVCLPEGCDIPTVTSYESFCKRYLFLQDDIL